MRTERRDPVAAVTAGRTCDGAIVRVVALTVVVALASACSSHRDSGSGAMMMTAQAAAGGKPGTVGGGSALQDPDKLVDQNTYRLAPGDLIDVKFPYHPEENERVPVRPDGRIGLQVIGDVMAAGLTVKELEQVVTEKSAVTLRDPQPDSTRVQKAEWLIVLGVCTHLGCVPLGQKDSEPKGEFGGWYCPCHGSRFSPDGSVIEGPAVAPLERSQVITPPAGDS